jgi:hypothetical protein
MRKVPIPVLAAALTTAALLTVGPAVQASAGVHGYTGFGSGTGATPQAAETAAVANLEAHQDCFPPTTLISDTQQSDGTWLAKISERCLTPS